MKTPPVPRAALALLALCTMISSAPRGVAQDAPRPVPEPLKPWEAWATWGDDALLRSPSLYSDASKPLAFWPSELSLSANATGATFRQTVAVYSPCWVPLPGGKNIWPAAVTVGGKPAAVLERDGRPVIKLEPGTKEISGSLAWKSMPQRVALPRETGIVSLAVNGAPVENPLWDNNGQLWLNRSASPEEAAGPDTLEGNLYVVLEDGIPLWLRTRVELIVSGKSREVDLGEILPAGWKVSSVESPIPVAVEEDGRAKAQVRAGKWIVSVSAFRLDNAKEVAFAGSQKPFAPAALVGFRARPDFRVLEIGGADAVDVTMTTFPQDWRNLPVYRWDTANPLLLQERMRGMGDQDPEGLRIARSLWLDGDGRSYTFRDAVTGQMQKVWRLDAAPGQDLGSVRIGGGGQLITRDPANGAPGVEIRTRNLSLEATGRMAAAPSVSATGWQTDADGVEVTLNLPPGWRMFALFGADWVSGDWVTSWSLLDIFVVLFFGIAVFRLWGAGAAALAFLALVLSYQEPGAPRLFWLALLAPLAILKYLRPGRLQKVVLAWKWVTVALLVLLLVPFFSAQVQQALYPQLENGRGGDFARGISASPSEMQQQVDFEGETDGAQNATAPQAMPAQADKLERSKDSRGGEAAEYLSSNSFYSSRNRTNSNLGQVAQARIQTGPGVPEWNWRAIRFGWSGPVTASQTFRPLLIPSGLERLLTVARIGLLALLLALLLGARRPRVTAASPATAALAALALLVSGASASAQYPDPQMLGTLRDRLLQRDLPPNAAEIPQVTLRLDGRKVTMDAQVHAARLAAVPLPGKFPTWAPLSVSVDGKPGAPVRRGDGYLWVALGEGVHGVRVEGLLGEADEWEWTFVLRPRSVQIEAPGWTVSGVNPDGVPEAQVFFSRQQKKTGTEAAYDRQDFQTIAVVERNLELGLVWQVQTVVRRLTPRGKALALRVPLLPGERVLSGNVPIKDGAAEARLGANEESIAWQSELDQAPDLALSTRPGDTWAERWQLVASPVWNVAFEGLTPVFEPGNPDLVPVWRPWPGESVKLALGRPEALPGATVTVRRALHQIGLGDRQRTASLDLSLTSSLGEDFVVTLPPAAQITGLALNGQTIPARVDRGGLVVPLKPGEQDLRVLWKTPTALDRYARAEGVSLPAETANVTTVINVPADRWVLLAGGPLRGPAVRFWGVLAFSLLAGAFLGRLRNSPLKTIEWLLLGIGLTQVSVSEACIVVAWLFLLAWRGRADTGKIRPLAFDFLQILIVAVTAIALGILIHAVGAGLLGSPEMFISGNGSTPSALRWYLDRGPGQLPEPWLISISVWWYRLAMLAWALWLAMALLRWLGRGWTAFGNGGYFKPLSRAKSVSSAPPVPKA